MIKKQRVFIDFFRYWLLVDTLPILIKKLIIAGGNNCCCCKQLSPPFKALEHVMFSLAFYLVPLKLMRDNGAISNDLQENMI
ncbi:hypothetical protein [uncultured Vagococcus sp.]|uniref:hypothetical protein n=1 Tax=uncultured Vagococcus sp. TaxID=189676 RepID=UPI0028D0EDFB|nr:hypothetical protein [uncultured Vagococcus sp.]